jgi:threonine dehydrogenase-like Zn-dependent dehydrogenase
MDRGQPPDQPFDAVIDASNAAHLPALALDLVEPAGRVVYIGLAGNPSHVDTRTLAIKDVTAVGVLSGSPALDATIAAYAGGAVDPGRLLPLPSASSRSAPCSPGNGRRRPDPGPRSMSIHCSADRTPT